MKIGFTLKPPNAQIADFKKQLVFFEEIGAGSVEIPLYELDVLCGKKIVQEELNFLQETLKPSKLNFSLHGSISVNLMDEEYLDDHIEILKRDIEVSEAINSKILVTHFGYTNIENYKNKEKYKKLLKKQTEIYFKMAEYAKSHNVILAIENIFPFTSTSYAPLPNEIAEEISSLNHPNAKTTIDFSHAYLNCTHNKVDFIEQIKTMVPLTRHLHIHDSFGRLKKMDTYMHSEDVTYGQGDIHLPLGWGDIPFEKIFSTFSFSPDIFLNFELSDRYKRYYQSSYETAKKLILLMK
jgi:sugar phosphate isomerase/epimerase